MSVLLPALVSQLQLKRHSGDRQFSKEQPTEHLRQRRKQQLAKHTHGPETLPSRCRGKCPEIHAEAQWTGPLKHGSAALHHCMGRREEGSTIMWRCPGRIADTFRFFLSQRVK